MIDPIVHVHNSSDKTVEWCVGRDVYVIPPGAVRPVQESHYRIGCKNTTPIDKPCMLKLVNQEEGTLAFAAFEAKSAEQAEAFAKEALSAAQKITRDKKTALKVIEDSMKASAVLAAVNDDKADDKKKK